MPTENRSSNTEMVSVPRELTPEMREAFHISYEAYEDGQGECPDSQWRAMLRVAPKPAPQPHPEPRQERCDTCHGLGEVATGTVTHHGYNQPPEPDLEVCPECSGEQRWYVADDIDLLVRELDVLLNGDGAVPQAKLCDLVAQVAASKKHQGEPVAWLDLSKLSAAHMAYATKMKVNHRQTQLYTHDDPGEVERLRYKAELYDEVWELATGLGYMNVTTAISKLRSQLAECEAMAAMVAEREWAEHVGTGDVSSKVEAAFTQLHNDLHEASEKLAERDALLRELADAPPAAMEVRLQQKVKAALSASA